MPFELNFSFSDSLILLAFLGWFYYVIINNPRVLILSIMIFKILMCAISFYMIETGAYITELGMMSYRTGNLIFHLVYLFVFFQLFLYFEKRISFSLKNSDEIQINTKSIVNHFIFLILIIAVTLEIISLIIYGTIFDGLNKIDVVQNNIIIQVVGSTATYISVFCGYFFFAEKKKKHLLLFIFHFIALVLSGQKFTSLLISTSFFFAPLLIDLKILKLNLRLVSFFLVMFSIIISLSLISYSGENTFVNELGVTALGAVFYRPAFLSGHAQWAAFDLFFNQQFKLYDIYNFLYFNTFIVELLHPLDTSASLEKGITFGMIYPSYYLLTIPIIYHLPIIAFHAFVIALCFKIFISFIKTRNILGAMIISVILNAIVRVFIQGNFISLVSLKNILLFIIFFIYIFLISLKFNKKF